MMFSPVNVVFSGPVISSLIIGISYCTASIASALSVITASTRSPSWGSVTLTEKVPSFLAVALPSVLSSTATRTSADGSVTPVTVMTGSLVYAGTPLTSIVPSLASTSATPGVGTGVGSGVGVGTGVGTGVGSDTVESSFMPESTSAMRASSAASGARPTIVCVIMYRRPRCSVA